MAISVDGGRVSSYSFKKEDIGSYVFNEVKCTSDSQVAYKFRITAWFDAIKEEERKVEVRFNSHLYSDPYSAFSSYNVVTKVLVDNSQVASKTITSLSKDSSVAGATWDSELEYAEDGTLECVVKATLSCTSSGIYPPKSANVEIKLTFPEISKLRNPTLKAQVNGQTVDCIAYARINGEWIECEAYGYQNGNFRKGV